jgi:hypothetical protein
VDGNAEISFFNVSDGIEIVANRRALHLITKHIFILIKMEEFWQKYTGIQKGNEDRLLNSFQFISCVRLAQTHKPK